MQYTSTLKGGIPVSAGRRQQSRTNQLLHPPPNRRIAFDLNMRLPKHPRQPTNLVPLLGEELYADKVSTAKVSLPISVQKKAADVPLQSALMAEE